MNTCKSILSVVVGFLTVAILSTLTDTILESFGVFPPIGAERMMTWQLILALAYRCVFTVLGGYVAAKLAPQNILTHVRVLAIIGTVAGMAGVFVGWNLSDHWYPIAIAVTGYPLVMWGGNLYMKKSQNLKV